MYKFIKIINKDTNKIIAEKVLVANSFWTRFKGLMLKTNLKDYDGILLYPCKAIHMLFMFISIDVIFMDINKKIIAIYSNLIPWISYTRYHTDAFYTLELRPGSISQNNLKIGNNLDFIDNEDFFKGVTNFSNKS